MYIYLYIIYIDREKQRYKERKGGGRYIERGARERQRGGGRETDKERVRGKERSSGSLI